MDTPGGGVPGDGVGANNHSPLLFGGLWKHARRSEEKTAIEETPRHSGLDPESRIVKPRREAPLTFLFAGERPLKI
jgi:hypothetical protein